MNKEPPYFRFIGFGKPYREGHTMNIIDYIISKRIERLPFDSLMAAAINKADCDKREKLEELFPDIVEDAKILDSVGVEDEHRAVGIASGYLMGISGR